MDPVILHCDCNSFFASVESIDHPEYKLVPMAVGGDPDKRHGIILAKNELAKKYHVNTAETLWQARQKCPQLLIVPPHHEKYEAVSRQINQIYQQYTDRVEPFSIDESWLDVTASQQLFGNGKQIADQLRQRIRQQVGVTISVGVSFTKTFAKMGSDYKKPDATTVIDRQNYRQLLWPLPIGDMMFVGKSTGQLLMQQGYDTIGAVAQANRDQIINIMGKTGGALWDACNGLDSAEVALVGSTEAAKSISNSTTFDHDLTDWEEIQTGILGLADEVSFRLRQQEMKAYVIAVAVKNERLEVRQKQQKQNQPTSATQTIYELARSLVKELWKPGQRVRLLAVAASNLTSGAEIQDDLFTNNETKLKNDRLDDTLDEIRQRYGRDKVGLARLKEKEEEPSDDKK